MMKLSEEPPIAVKSARRRGLWHFIAAVAVGSLFASSLAHGEFWATKFLGAKIVWFCSIPSAVVGLALALFRRTRRAGRWLLLLSLGSFLCVLGMLLAWFPVFKVEELYARHFVVSRLVPALELRKSAEGSYPPALAWEALGLPNPPRLLLVGSYSATANEYTITYHSPMVCSEFWVYRSGSGQWSEGYEQCWY